MRNGKKFGGWYTVKKMEIVWMSRRNDVVENSASSIVVGGGDE